MTRKEKLIKELNEFGFNDTINCCVDVNKVVNFILAREAHFMQVINKMPRVPSVEELKDILDNLESIDWSSNYKLAQAIRPFLTRTEQSKGNQNEC